MSHQAVDFVGGRLRRSALSRQGYLSPVSPSPYSIVSHPPKIAAGWGNLVRDGAWASPRFKLVTGNVPSVPEFLWFLLRSRL
jgi:hypothetical protein